MKSKKLILLNSGIGNIEDLSQKNRKAFESGKFFIAEDTRKCLDLLDRLGIKSDDKKILSFHDHSEVDKLKAIIENFDGETLYYLSDAGSPVLSDPALPLLRIAHDLDFEIMSYSGISSVTMALELSLLPSNPFTFHGFLPRESGKIREKFQHLNKGTHLFFESPHRVGDTCLILQNLYPASSVVLLKELTKTYQKVYRFKAKEWDQMSSKVDFRGEFVLAFYLDQDSPKFSPELLEQVEKVKKSGGGIKDLAQLLSLITDDNSKKIYQELIQAKKS